ncbi:COG4648 family protein [Vibrio mangrovi]|uniref:DNA gyrase subunit B n=1 Tax=Vibrio mangrovi TaxID=474394 RepID=A0A1Y6IR57_9VIBR|nr:hypothetical protein [Vibrio mangrovi]MDW6001848.1 hypothetical protein [Vibrio mangrovi]SMS00125.1 hypothetical protein VIM7927_01366 [Vibrio mangrovi]
MYRLLAILSAICLLAYPFIIYLGLNEQKLKIISGLLIFLFLFRIFTSRQTKVRELRILALGSAMIGIILILLSAIFRNQGWLKFYPVAVNFCMLILFLSSIIRPPTIIERLARLKDPQLPPAGVRYTSRVTTIWCGFFVLNGSIALYTCFQPISVWTLYNGLVSYFLMGSLLLGEWVIRQFILRNS